MYTHSGTQMDCATGQQEKEEHDNDDPDQYEFVVGRKKRARGESFKMREDKLLCDAWFATSLDPIHGTEQKSSTLWANIHTWFHEYKHFEPYADKFIGKRGLKSLNH